MKLGIIVASTRPTRVGHLVGQWAHERAVEHGKFDIELLDLAKFNLPVFRLRILTLSASNIDPIQSSESPTNIVAYKARGGVSLGRRLGVKRRAESQLKSM